jgi:hypothetical protein
MNNNGTTMNTTRHTWHPCQLCHSMASFARRFIVSPMCYVLCMSGMLLHVCSRVPLMFCVCIRLLVCYDILDNNLNHYTPQTQHRNNHTHNKQYTQHTHTNTQNTSINTTYIQHLTSNITSVIQHVLKTHIQPHI